MHCIHVGYVGAELNVYYDELADFLLGWFGADICGDDNRGEQPTRPVRPPVAPPPEELADPPIQEPTKDVPKPPAKPPRPPSQGLERPNSPSPKHESVQP